MNLSKLISIVLLSFLICMTQEAAFSQTKKSGSSPINTKGGGLISKSAKKENARRGGRNTLPVGVEGKKINIGIGTGVAIPSLSIKSEEHATIGFNTHFYAHYLFGGRNTMGIGLNSNIIFLGTSNASFYNQNPSITFASSSPWLAYTISPSFISNFTIKKRISAQFMINMGLMNVSIPPNMQSYTDTIMRIGDPSIVQNSDYTYKSGTEKGWFASGAMQFNYALTHNIEARIGLDYYYGRFNYYRILTSYPLLPTEKVTREMKLIDLFAGFAFSF